MAGVGITVSWRGVLVWGAFLLPVIVPLQAAPFRAEQLVGSWYGERVLGNGVIRIWVTTRRADGTYQDHLKECRDGKQITERREFGVWELRDGVEYVTTRVIQSTGGAAAPFTPSGTYEDQYDIISVTEQAMTAESRRTGTSYRTRKVYKGYRFGCADQAI